MATYPNPKKTVVKKAAPRKNLVPAAQAIGYYTPYVPNLRLEALLKAEQITSKTSNPNLGSYDLGKDVNKVLENADKIYAWLTQE